MTRHCLALVVCLILWAPASGSEHILVDMAAGTVDGVDLRQSGPELKKKLGARVTKTTELLEGEPSDVWVIAFGKRAIHRHWNGFSFTDAAFRTKEGVGVGSTVADFDKAYGLSSFSEEEGCHWIFEDKTVIFALESGCAPDRQQKVGRVWVAIRAPRR
jgi:hypothetical protein